VLRVVRRLVLNMELRRVQKSLKIAKIYYER